MKKKKHNNINIISGKWKGKKIKVINNKILKPTMCFIRENLFNWLMKNNLYKLKCLDCYAGTGILSFEALSRNALLATLIENNKKIFQQLKQNVYLLKIKNIFLIYNNTLNFLAQKSNIQYDLVFVDPPFCKKNILLQKTCILLEKNNWLTNNAKIFIEYKKKSNKFFLPKNWIKYKKKTFGIVTYLLYQKKIYA
ncbi:16S rRNA (guanine(966)-N(2))-methyltransferase RsmD [Enterobacteriaceae endosymbiont of Donacia bicoloricornis]|uniref:16S rRNA (guanine(966)-N(2))-methyltransferase RsmD n=1 Tax=Enterobacteriaceae endosymbiont of Donacia bicoloricornis TaxID=2675772 RepID=UPI00144992DD|nr:16S rRNA (guanine(966)-N(2))-methyltransferase RsmD [Enterobacteriaceae endosymbiont of Donacia bicoloricornis]QJC37571.1 16S rRNA (guanine(966)-N(2))-methyltransferase RsmD [Enterobacteriaceae endosymbiont of Donacia bicoloricornis]